MNKILLSIYTFTLLSLAGCYDATGNAKVRISLGNLPAAERTEKISLADRFFSLFVKNAHAQSVIPGNIIKIHVTAYKDSSLLTAESFNIPEDTSGSYVETSIPAGDNIYIIAAGENDLSQAEYYGYTVRDLRSGETVNVTLNVYDAATIQPDETSWYSRINLQQVSGASSDYIQWSSPGFRVKYHLYESVWNGSEYVLEKRYEGYGFSTPVSSGYWWFLYLEFEGTGIKSVPLELNNG